MDWKKFLKPDLGKIILFAAIFLLLFFVPFNCNFTAVDGEGGTAIFCTSIYQRITDITCCVSPLSVAMDLVMSQQTASIVLTVIASYLLSCLMVWIHCRFKNRKKRENYMHIKDANMIMGQLEKWGRKR
jgi:hypothetical protein